MNTVTNREVCFYKTGKVVVFRSGAGGTEPGVSAFCEPPWNPCLRDQRAPAGARGGPATPARVRIVITLLPGGSLRSPPANFLSPRWGGIRYRIHEIIYLVCSLSRLKPELHVSPSAIRFGVFWPPGRLTLG